MTAKCLARRQNSAFLVGMSLRVLQLLAVPLVGTLMELLVHNLLDVVVPILVPENLAVKHQLPNGDQELLVCVAAPVELVLDVSPDILSESAVISTQVTKSFGNHLQIFVQNLVTQRFGRIDVLQS